MKLNFLFIFFCLLTKIFAGIYEILQENSSPTAGHLGNSLTNHETEETRLLEYFDNVHEELSHMLSLPNSEINTQFYPSSLTNTVQILKTTSLTFILRLKKMIRTILKKAFIAMIPKTELQKDVWKYYLNFTAAFSKFVR